jgi:capsular polysaccharide biosynthesis protein
LQTEVGVNNPRLQEKFNVRHSLQKQLDTQVDEYRKKLKDRISTQTGKIAQLEKVRAERLTDMIHVQAQRDQLSTLVHDVVFYQEETERMQRAANHSRLQSQLSFSNISIVDYATPPTSVSFPKPLVVGLLSVCAGMALGVLLALVAEVLDRRVRTSQDLRNAFDVPLLGEMIDIKPKKASFVSRFKPRLRIGARPPRLPAKA